MKVVVCIKQVPLVEHLRFDTRAGRLIREGVESEINPFDKRAITEAVELKKKFGAETIVLTMGPPQAASALREALAMGIDRAVHLVGREFAGADTMATARTLALAIRRTGFDLILCGKYSTDAETAQVPPMLAEILDIPQVTGLTKLEFQDSVFTASRESDNGFETLEGKLPAVMSTAERLIKPIKVTPQDLDLVRDHPIEEVTAHDLSADTSLFGVSGSPTWVEAIYSIEPKRKCILRKVDNNAASVVKQTIEDLMNDGLFAGDMQRQRETIRPHVLRSRPQKAIWTVAETIEGELRHVTFELIGRSIELADKIDGEVGVVLIGSRLDRHIQVLAEHGADKIYLADSPVLANYLTESYAAVLGDAIREHKPWAVLLPSTANGRDLAPRIAARLALGLTGDCIGLEIDEKGRLVQLKPAFGGNIVAPILTRTLPAMATVRPGMLHRAASEPGRQSEIIKLPLGDVRTRVQFVSSEIDTEEGVRMDDANAVIAIGMGVGGPENFPLVHELARALKASIGGTRRVVDAGWLPRQVQIGLTGRAVSPPLYVGLGVRGAFNHTVGIQRAHTIVAVNNNPEADIFKQCDYGLVGDWQVVVRELLRVVGEKVPN